MQQVRGRVGAGSGQVPDCSNPTEDGAKSPGHAKTLLG